MTWNTSRGSRKNGGQDTPRVDPDEVGVVFLARVTRDCVQEDGCSSSLDADVGVGLSLSSVVYSFGLCSQGESCLFSSSLVCQLSVRFPPVFLALAFCVASVPAPRNCVKNVRPGQPCFAQTTSPWIVSITLPRYY